MADARTTFADPAAAAARLLFRLALILLLVLTPVAELFFHGPLYVLLPVGACILIIAGRVAQEGESDVNLAQFLRSPLTGAALFLLFWAGLSLIWTPFPDEAATRYGKTLGTAVVVFFAILALPEKTRADNLYLLPIGLALTAIATIILTFFAPQMFWQGDHPDATLAQRCVMTLTVLLWPALGALGLREKWILATVLAVLVTAAVLATFLKVALVGLALGAVVYAVTANEPGRVARILGFGLAALVLLAPAIALAAFACADILHLPPPGPILVFAHEVKEQWPRLITGHGLDFATRAREIGVLPPSAPRSILFKIWYDLGILGAAALALLLLNGFVVAGRTPLHAAPALLSAIVAGLVIALWGTETTQIWWMSLNGLNAIALALVYKGLPLARRPHAPGTEDSFAAEVPEAVAATSRADAARDKPISQLETRPRR